MSEEDQKAISEVTNQIGDAVNVGNTLAKETDNDNCSRRNCRRNTK